MDVINIYPISGLFNELYYPDAPSYNLLPLDTKTSNSLRRINCLFWAELLCPNNVNRLLRAIENANYEGLGYVEQAILANKELFKIIISQAPLQVINQGISDRQMFAYVEQIEITCKLFSKYLFAPFSITIQDGFLEPNLSAKALVESLFDPTQNPYLPFLEKNVFRLLGEVHPKIAWINGQPTQSSLTIAAKVKESDPDVFIAVRNHSSEYFSLNKIDEYLLANMALFSVVDCVVLDDSEETCKRLEKIVCQNKNNISSCRNLIYIDRSTGVISKTHAERVEYSFEECASVRPRDSINCQGYISPHTVMNLKLNPNTACHWNKCSFCAINKKYKYITNIETISLDKKIETIKHYLKEGVRYFWFEDEAIPPEQLDAFADAIIYNNLELRWQVRSRIDERFTEALARKLYRAGLREIRFGLESASPRVLKLMNKFPESVSLRTVEEIVRLCTSAGIHVHFPMIVGFPTELPEERVETYRFLISLQKRYRRVSFNINILMLDVASDLFRNYQKYSIESIIFPCPLSEYLGNMVEFSIADSKESKESIDIKRNEFMRETLYPWMPKNTVTKPNIFYRLSETIRNTLIWRCNESQQGTGASDSYSEYRRNEYLSEWKLSDGSFLIYDWMSHRLFNLSPSFYSVFSGITSLSVPEIENSLFYQALVSNNLLHGEKG